MNLRLLRREQTHLTPGDPGGHVRLLHPCCIHCKTWAPARCPLAPHDQPCPACLEETPAS